MPSEQEEKEMDYLHQLTQELVSQIALLQRLMSRPQRPPEFTDEVFTLRTLFYQALPLARKHAAALRALRGGRAVTIAGITSWSQTECICIFAYQLLQKLVDAIPKPSIPEPSPN